MNMFTAKPARAPHPLNRTATVANRCPFSSYNGEIRARTKMATTIATNGGNTKKNPIAATAATQSATTAAQLVRDGR